MIQSTHLQIIIIFETETNISTNTSANIITKFKSWSRLTESYIGEFN